MSKKHTLLLHIFGPMQSWGDDSKFTIRDTCGYPTKSAIIGLICAAFGRRRSESIRDLIDLRMGVRIEQEGNKECDFHTVRNYYRASGDFESEKSIISYRYFLSDAQFIVGLEGGDEKIEILKQIHAALRKPRFQLYLGRKSFVPSRPVYLKDGFKEGVSLESALKSYPMKFFGEKKEKIPDKKECRIVVEMPIEKILGDPECNYNYHLDQPTEFCFAPECHKFSERCVVFQDAVVSVVYGGEI